MRDNVPLVIQHPRKSHNNHNHTTDTQQTPQTVTYEKISLTSLLNGEERPDANTRDRSKTERLTDRQTDRLTHRRTNSQRQKNKNKNTTCHRCALYVWFDASKTRLERKLLATFTSFPSNIVRNLTRQDEFQVSWLHKIYKKIPPFPLYYARYN